MLGMIKKALITKTGNLTIKSKLLLSYMLLIIIPLTILTLVTYLWVSDIVVNQTISSTKMAFEQARTSLEYKINNIANASDIIIMDNNLNKALKRDINTYEIPQQVEDYGKLSVFLENMIRSSGLYRIRLYIRDGLFYSDEGKYFFNTETIKTTKWYNARQKVEGRILWAPSSLFDDDDKQRTVSALRILWDPDKFSRQIGILRIELLEKDIVDIIKSANMSSTGLVCLKNQNEVVLSVTNSVSLLDWVKRSKMPSSQKIDYLPITSIDGFKSIILSQGIKNTDWNLVSIVPLNEILSTAIGLRNGMIIMTLIVVLLSIIIAYRITTSGISRITPLVENIKEVQDGKLNEISIKSSHDEIGELIQNYNFMIKKINSLIATQFKTGQELKAAELKALQSQINPHFLYNTLDLINWKAIKNNNPEIEFLVSELSKFYKISLSDGRDIITIREEIEHAKAYVNIQNKRFKNCIELIVDIDEKILDYHIIKIILQPLVENAIQHGILQKGKPNGVIRISAKLYNDIIQLSVFDNGIGMEQEYIRKIYDRDIHSNQMHSYGIYNIQQRIKLYFGSEYGLIHESEPGKYTIATVTLPALKDIIY